MMIETPRQERGLTIAKMPSQIKRINAHTYVVKSQSNNGEYRVSGNEDEWICECPDNKYRHVECKHIYATKFSQSLRAEVAVRRIAPIENLSNCVYCGSSNLKKKGIRKNKSGNIQKFYCRDCHKYFTFNIGFERMKHNPQAITSAMQLYFTGESLRNVQKFLKLQGVSVSHVSVLKWIRKYVKLMNEYLEKIKPNVSDIWRADELYVKIKGYLKYLFAVMDDETRFWIAQEVAQTKDRHDARKLLQIAKQVTGKKPMTFITDGLPAYHDAYKKEFWPLKGPRTEHIQHITLKGDRNNNKMERMNGEVRDREKVLRGLKKEDSAILSGYQLFHNYVRPHESLDGKTPSEACGIKVEGQDKWKTLIENASKSKN